MYDSLLRPRPWLAALPVFDQGSLIIHSPIATPDRLLRQMRAVVEDQLREAVILVLGVTRIRHERISERIKTVIVSCGTIDDVPRRVRVVQLPRVDDVVVDGGVAVVDMAVAAEVEVHAVLVEQWLKDGGAVGADSSSRVVEWSMTEDDNPRSLAAVYGCKVVLQPVELLVHESEGAGELR